MVTNTGYPAEATFSTGSSEYVTANEETDMQQLSIG